MKKHDWIATILAAALLGLLVMTSGCQTARNVGERIVDSDASSLVVRYAVAKYVGGDIERADRILEVVSEVRTAVTGEGESVYLAHLRELVRAEIDWESLDEADRYAAGELLSIVVDEVRNSVGEGVLSADDRMTVARLLDLIEAGARAGVPDEGSVSG